MWRLKTLVRPRPGESHEKSDDEKEDDEDLTKQPVSLKGSFAFEQIPEHDRARFQAALTVRQRAAIHVENGMDFDEHRKLHTLHYTLQMQAKEQEEKRILAHQDAERKQKIMSKASLVRKIDFATQDMAAWNKNQGLDEGCKLPDVAKQRRRSSLLCPDAALPGRAHDGWHNEGYHHHQHHGVSHGRGGAPGWVQKTQAFMKGIMSNFDKASIPSKKSIVDDSPHPSTHASAIIKSSGPSWTDPHLSDTVLPPEPKYNNHISLHDLATANPVDACGSGPTSSPFEFRSWHGGTILQPASGTRNRFATPEPWTHRAAREVRSETRPRAASAWPPCELEDRPPRSEPGVVKLPRLHPVRK